MGVVAIKYYTITCDNCKDRLDNYVSNLHIIGRDRSEVEKEAVRRGFEQISTRKWLCPTCSMNRRNKR